MADQEQNRRQALTALRKAVSAFLTAKAHLNNMAELLGVKLNEDADHELARQAYEMQRIGTGKTMLEDLDYFVRRTTD